MSENWILPGLPQAEEQVSLPGESRGFLPPGLIGQWMSITAHRIYVACDESETLKISKAEGCLHHIKTTNGAFFFFKTPALAGPTMKEYGVDYTDLTWYLEAQKDRLFWTSEESKAKWKRDPINASVRVRGLGSRKYRHEFQLIALPCAIRAVARCYGGMDLEFDIAPLFERDVQSDDFFARMCGDPDAKKQDLKEFEKNIDDQVEKGVPVLAAIESARATLPIPLEYSVLWQQRKQLWAELGESDPHRYTVNQGDKKTDTVAPHLSMALGIVQPWTEPRWARVVLTPDPRVDALDKEGQYRDNLAVIVDLYKDEAEAKAAFESLQSQAPEEPGAPTLPGQWVDLGEEAFVDALKGLWGQPGAIVATQMGCSQEELLAWGAHLGLQ